MKHHYKGECGYIFSLEHLANNQKVFLFDIASLEPPIVNIIKDRIYALILFDKELSEEMYQFLTKLMPQFNICKEIVAIDEIKRDNNVFFSLPGQLDLSDITIN